MYNKALTYIDERLMPVLIEFEKEFGSYMKTTGGNANDF